MSNSKQDMAKMLAIGDQAWTSTAGYFQDIKRIAKHGPDGSEQDTLIVRGVFHTVLGELYARAAIATEGAADDDPR